MAIIHIVLVYVPDLVCKKPEKKLMQCFMQFILVPLIPFYHILALPKFANRASTCTMEGFLELPRIRHCALSRVSPGTRTKETVEVIRELTMFRAGFGACGSL